SPRERAAPCPGAASAAATARCRARQVFRRHPWHGLLRASSHSAIAAPPRPCPAFRFAVLSSSGTNTARTDRVVSRPVRVGACPPRGRQASQPLRLVG